METFIFLGIFAILAVAVLVYGRFRANKRTKVMEATARILGLSFSKNADEALLTRLGRCSQADPDRHWNVCNIMKGRVEDVDVTIMDQSTGGGSGSSRSTRRQSTVFLFQSDLLRLPAFDMLPEHPALAFLTDAFRLQDIDFDVHPAFSERYLVRGDDEEAVRAAFSEELLGFLAETEHLFFYGGGDQFLYYRSGSEAMKADSSLTPEEIGAFLNQGLALCNLFTKQR